MRSRIDELMSYRGMTVEELAARAGLSRRTVLKAKTHGDEGIEACTLRTLICIARGIGVRTKDLYDDEYMR